MCARIGKADGIQAAIDSMILHNGTEREVMYCECMYAEKGMLTSRMPER
jgi:hypothetical protein